MDQEQKLEFVKNHIESYPDFPKPGILFRDLFSVLRNPCAFRALQEVMIEHVSLQLTPKPEAVVALDARGFLIGPLIALHFDIPFIPIRKRGKLPGQVIQVSFALEYGTDIFEIQSVGIKSGQNVLIVDDLLATGGSLNAACQLVQQLHATVLECLVIIELVDLKGRDNVKAPVHSLIQF
ncbi:adenine phosphoribosyltransferase [Cryptotermes secundus]|uniref:adenine phosphoribosyltransferase n=1 Tax=Cryptotermes secundus TaxID=105785 RepID=UPI000CD7D0F0|nr:adenine phosphoribosyltransferase [Cryptotermes secundus]